MPVSPDDSIERTIEADAGVQVVLPYLTALGIRPDQIRAQHTFSLRLGRNMIHSVGGRGVQTGRYDFLILNPEGRPLFIVELKAPEESLTDDDRDQAISYARLVDPIAPVALVTNTRISRLYDTITKELLETADTATLIRGKGRLTADEDLRVRADALEHFIGYSLANVSAFSRLQRAARMRTLRGGDGRHERKYEPDIYVRRESVREDITSFLGSSATVFALGGKSGYGKTNEMCAVAEELGESHVVLFFTGLEMSGPLASVVVEEFNWFFSESLPLPQMCRRLARLAERSGRPLVIMLDAVDECEQPLLPQQLADLASHLDQFQPQIKLILSAKPGEWRRFAVFRGVPSATQDRLFRSSRTRAPAVDPSTTPVNESPMSLEIELFTTSERDQAVGLYTSGFGLTGAWSLPILEAARDPFMLRVIAEVASSAGAIPNHPGEYRLVREYLHQKLERTADPNRALLELIEVARALAAREDPEPPDAYVRSTASRFRTQSVPPPIGESTVREHARLPATASLANELVAFGVLIRSLDSELRATLTFAYDRVRDYVIAAHVLRLDHLNRDEVRGAALKCFPNTAASGALLWYLPHLSDEQWEGFVEAAAHQVGRFLDSYERMREHLLGRVRQFVEPGGSAPAGAVFTGVRAHGQFSLALFQQVSQDLPRVCHDPSTFINWRNLGEDGLIPKRLLATGTTTHGFWFLRNPERYAAEHMKAQLAKALKEGELEERASDYLLAERIVALTRAYHDKLQIPSRRQLFADLFIAPELYPLDLVDLKRRVQVQLAYESYQDQHMRERSEAARRAYEAAGHKPRTISVSSAWTNDDLRKWKEQAVREVAAGQDFTATGALNAELPLLARAVNALLTSRTRLEEPLLPAGDLRAPVSSRGQHNFEDGYSDSQLARLLEVFFSRVQEAYGSVLASSFSEALRQRMGSAGMFSIVLCRRLAPDPSFPAQFNANVDYGRATPLDGSLMPASGVVAAVVYPGGATTIEAVGNSGVEGIVSTPQGRFRMKWRGSRTLVSIISPSDAPPFVRHGSRTAPRNAPVRAEVYDLVREALDALSMRELSTLGRQT